MKNNLQIVFASDDGYAQHLGVSLLSLFESNKSFDRIDVYILDNGISHLNKENLKKIAEEFVNINLFFIGITAKLALFKKQYGIPSSISISSYSRLFLPELLEHNIDKVIYADSDAIFLNSLMELWLTEFDNYTVAGVQDIVEIEFKKEIGLRNEDIYVNAGFLLINLKKWRNEHKSVKLIEVILQHGGSVPHHDQGIINSVFRNEILVLHPKYNVVTTFYEFSEVEKLKNYFSLDHYYTQKQFDDAKQHPVFLHFTPSYSKRPWFLHSRHPRKDDYLAFLKKTNWKDYTLQKDTRKSTLLILDFMFWNFGPSIVKKILRLKKHLIK